ncbi:MAG: VWA domain-containing protein, partial [Candidatus Latescibacterota bacterium]
MFGLGFLNSGFLIALGAIALPVVIHLLNRRRVHKVPFSTLAFIYELSRRRMRKVNLRRILILLLRTLAVLFIVFTFAKPTLRTAAALFLPGAAPKSVIIGLDASYSMGVDWATGTAFTQAKQIAKQVADDAGKNDLVNVVVFSSQAEPLFEKGTRNKQLIKRAI